MSVKKFVALVAQYCQQNQIAAPEKILQGAPVLVDDVIVALHHDANVAPSLAYAYCDLGMPEPGDEKEQLRKLLLANLKIHFCSGQSLMISPSTGHILLAQDIALDVTSADMLSDMLVNMVASAKNWQKNQFANLSDEQVLAEAESLKRRASSQRSRLVQIPQPRSPA